MMSPGVTFFFLALDHFCLSCITVALASVFFWCIDLFAKKSWLQDCCTVCSKRWPLQLKLLLFLGHSFKLAQQGQQPWVSSGEWWFVWIVQLWPFQIGMQHAAFCYYSPGVLRSPKEKQLQLYSNVFLGMKQQPTLNSPIFPRPCSHSKHCLAKGSGPCRCYLST